MVLAFAGTPVVSKLYFVIHVLEKLTREQKVKWGAPDIFYTGLTNIDRVNYRQKKFYQTRFHPRGATVDEERTIRLYETRR